MCTRRNTPISNASSATLMKLYSSVTEKSNVFQSIVMSVLSPFVVMSIIIACTYSASPVSAAPPFAVIAEELGYYPIMVPSSSASLQSKSTQQQEGTVQYVAKRVQRPSTQQAIDLAHYLRTMPNSKVLLAGTYWCSHTSHQKELFGVEAWNELNTKEPNTSSSSSSKTKTNRDGFTYMECAPQGYRSNPTICSNLQIDGYPTWIITTTTTKTTSQQKPTTVQRISGERSLADIAKAVEYPNTFDASLEEHTSPVGSAACSN
jgi:hypothetical protein